MLLLRSWQRLVAALGLLVALFAEHSAWSQGMVPDSTELRVLRQFYHHTGGAQWTGQSGWLGPANTIADVATWQGLRVNNGDVSEIYLPNNNLRGDIPACVGLLTGLQVLHLGGNSGLAGSQDSGTSWPSGALTGLPNLAGLYLYGCGLHGELGNEFDNKPNLAIVALAYNELTGELPSALVAAPALQIVDLAYNKLRGRVPATWASRRELTDLILAGNHFSGPLPAELGRLAALRYLWLFNNELSGQLPDSLVRCTQLKDVQLANNRFTGALPTEWGNWQHVVRIDLANNLLEGSLPAAWRQLSTLCYLHLPFNRLTGPLPHSWSQLVALRQIDISHNQLSGALPAGWSTLSPLQLLDMSANQLSGPIPATWKQWSCTLRLNLAKNQLSGEVPEGMSSPVLDLSYNQFSKRLPVSYATAWQQGTYRLCLEGNSLTGIPSFVRPPGSELFIGLTNNYLQFDSYEANLTNPGSGQYQFFDYGQRVPSPADTQYVVAGTRPWLRQRFGGAHNHYHWQRQVGQAWIDVAPTQDADSLLLPNVTESVEGTYRVRVTNDWLPWMTLYTKSVYVSMLPYTVPARNEPVNQPSSSLVNAAPANRTGSDDLINYVRTYTARTAFTDPEALRQAPVEEAQIKTDYLDGLGRPVQTVLHQDSPGRRDVVHPQAHDELNRQPKQYLPYTAAAGSGAAGAYRPNALREQYDFYRTPVIPGIPASGVAFAETQFETSPLNRPMVQASPGETWQLHALENHTIHLEERSNNAEQDTVRRWQPDYGSERENLDTAGVYASGTLWVKQTTDEQGQVAREYSDMEGRVVLKQVSTGRVGYYSVVRGTDSLRYERRAWLSTYYVYDDFGRLRAVIPPLAVQRLRQHRWVVDGAGLERLLFRYHYDDQGRLIEKKIPDQDGYTCTVYDGLNRPILVQDPGQRAQRQWLATKYDTLGRVIYTALLSDRGQTRAQWQTAASAATVLCEQPATVPGPGGAYYTNQAFPVLRSTDPVLSTTDYDSYDFNHDGAPDAQYLTRHDALLGDASYQAAPDLRTVGLPTRSRVRVLETAANAPGAWLTTSSFVDEKLRALQVQSTNARGYQDLVTNRYDFTGKVLGSYAVHHGPQGAGEDSVAVAETSSYDHAGRLLATLQRLGSGPAVTLAAHRYNELGQLLQKHLGDSTAAKALQTVDFSYNIRGWLTQVNDAQLAPQAGQRPDLFGLELSYDQGFSTNQFNGNIAGQKWRAASDNVERAYGYRYDQLSRILQGDFVARNAAGTWSAERDNYRFWAASYDANGNFLTARRRGLVQDASRTTPRRYGEIDNLRYRYQADLNSASAASNRLLRVDDLAPAVAEFGLRQPTRPDFQDGATSGSSQPDYTYDDAGSLISDRNKGIDTIRYNHLHLPTRIVWANGNRLEFRYSAAGQKVAKLATPAGKLTVRTDYLGAWQYEGDSLRWLNTSEGRALRFVQLDAARQPHVRYSYEYTIKDHLGNLRVAFRRGDRATHRATMELGLAEQEEAQFDYVRETRLQTTDAAAGQYVARLNAAAGKPIGPLKTLTVRKGDTLRIEAFGRYNQPVHNINYGFSLLSFVTSLLQQPPVAAPGDTRSARTRALPFLGVSLALVPQLTQLSNGVPKSYLRVLVFDQDSALLTSYTQQLTMAGKNNYQRLNIDLTAPQDGFVQAYVGNESDTDVYFDDISVDYQPTLLVQENQYDPFGLDLIGLNHIVCSGNEFTFNGKEKLDDFGVNYSAYEARLYDPVIGRWMTADPLSEEEPSWSLYRAFFDNPIKNIDPDGRLEGEFRDRQGNNLGNDGINDDKIYLLNEGVRARTEDCSINWGGELTKKQSDQLKKYSTEVCGLIIMDRVEEGSDYTISDLNTTGESSVTGYTLEPGGPSTTEKEKDKRIPEGVYNIDNYSSQKHPDNFIIYNDQVSKDRKILLHSGNRGSQTEGCVMPGKKKSNGSVGNSKAAMDELRTYIKSQGVPNTKMIINNKIQP
ncbi:DUF5675 family protein [Hymenobacter edaphi]|uniref:Uncharacterized protein n=1 Tax=Hymenobacter edaphi TaxID=2211146 RepID=A0A328BSF0_9BACT|nr:DUF5675 family protein [Hymenobacter edaphi]RAK70027.1 hypothetical protein DLM85_04015 [Hymenobacter edaphi]